MPRSRPCCELSNYDNRAILLGEVESIAAASGSVIVDVPIRMAIFLVGTEFVRGSTRNGATGRRQTMLDRLSAPKEVEKAGWATANLPTF